MNHLIFAIPSRLYLEIRIDLEGLPVLSIPNFLNFTWLRCVCYGSVWGTEKDPIHGKGSMF